MKLVPDWKDFWRWHSVWAAAAIAAWAEMPPDLKAYIPEEWHPFVAGVMFMAFMIGRIRQQP